MVWQNFLEAYSCCPLQSFAPLRDAIGFILHPRPKDELAKQSGLGDSLASQYSSVDGYAVLPV